MEKSGSDEAVKPHPGRAIMRFVSGAIGCRGIADGSAT